ncbi:unnamed protein product [Hydatigera taeniaeformis]|uniref:PB1 domain-containing protein n=1 Tax=Hydatigena taeniaeformis TaxID=6205 RepID=A0A0R3X4H5_HYDTA|nr:unnamed protein product [Hydatigera taeniaeformis]
MSFVTPKSDGDFAGKLVIKAQLGDDLRRILIHNEELTYDELTLMMQRVFKPKLDSLESFTIKYKDEDDEYITIAEEFDLSYAIRQYKTLRLKLIVPQAMDSSSIEVVCNGNVGHQPDMEGLFAEVRRLREDINKLSEKFDQLVTTFKPESNVNSCSATGSPTPKRSAETVYDSGVMPASSNGPSKLDHAPALQDSSASPYDSVLRKPFLSQPPEQQPTLSAPLFSNIPSTPVLQYEPPPGSVMRTPLTSSTAGVAPMPPKPLQPPASSVASLLPSGSFSQVQAQAQQPALLPATNISSSQLATSQSVFNPPGPRPAFMSGPPMPPQHTQQGQPIAPSPLVAASATPPPFQSQLPSQSSMIPPPSGVNSIVPPPPPMPMAGNRFPTSMMPPPPHPGVPPPPPSQGVPQPPQSNIPPSQPGVPTPQPGMQRMPLQLGGPPSGLFGAAMPPPPAFGAYDQRPTL